MYTHRGQQSLHSVSNGYFSSLHAMLFYQATKFILQVPGEQQEPQTASTGSPATAAQSSAQREGQASSSREHAAFSQPPACSTPLLTGVLSLQKQSLVLQKTHIVQSFILQI